MKEIQIKFLYLLLTYSITGLLSGLIENKNWVIRAVSINPQILETILGITFCGYILITIYTIQFIEMLRNSKQITKVNHIN